MRKDTSSKRKKETDSKLDASFPVVGFGASAGGLEALAEVFKNMPSNTGMAFVVILHLSASHESMLSEILSRTTRMPVTSVTDNTHLEQNHVYVLPPNFNLSLVDNTLRLTKRETNQVPHMPIDHFFRTLAKTHGPNAIGVVLSGTQSDGTLGLQEIKSEGGVTFAQEPTTAKYDGMPKAAIHTGSVDFVLSPEDIAKNIANLPTLPSILKTEIINGNSLYLEQEEFIEVLNMIRILMKVDFTLYKPATIKRRMARRMALNKISSLKEYANFLKSNPDEITSLYQDILIAVTRFFRDPQTFEALKTEVFPTIVKNRPENEPIRIWVPGCSTGEEVYSIAISLFEYLGKMVNVVPIQIFGTDISDEVLNKARAGIYVDSISADVSEQRLRQFFVKTNGHYQIAKFVRDACIFAKHDITRDPPFSRLDLISCRNVLIYLGETLQKRVLPIFHYALKSTGFLALGASETISSFSDMFTIVDTKTKIYSKRMSGSKPGFAFETKYFTDVGMTEPTKFPIKGLASESSDVQQEVDRLLLNKYVPASILVNKHMEILHFRGHTSDYLEQPSGRASFDLMKMIKEGLLFPLRTTIRAVEKSNAPSRKDNIRVKHNGGYRKVNVEVIPVKGNHYPKELYYLILFEEAQTPVLPDVGESLERVNKKMILLRMRIAFQILKKNFLPQKIIYNQLSDS